MQIPPIQPSARPPPETRSNPDLKFALPNPAHTAPLESNRTLSVAQGFFRALLPILLVHFTSAAWLLYQYAHLASHHKGAPSQRSDEGSSSGSHGDESTILLNFVSPLAARRMDCIWRVKNMGHDFDLRYALHHFGEVRKR